MKTMTNRAIMSKAARTLESAGFEKVSRQFGKRKMDSAVVFRQPKTETEVVLTFKVAKAIVEAF